jgi:hypothetical protein
MDEHSKEWTPWHWHPWQDHYISLPFSFLTPNSSFRILGTLVGSRSLLDLFVVKAFHEDLGTISNLLMFINLQATFMMFSLCYALHPGYLFCIVFHLQVFCSITLNSILVPYLCWRSYLVWDLLVVLSIT